MKWYKLWVHAYYPHEYYAFRFKWLRFVYDWFVSLDIRTNKDDVKAVAWTIAVGVIVTAWVWMDITQRIYSLTQVDIIEILLLYVLPGLVLSIKIPFN